MNKVIIIGLMLLSADALAFKCVENGKTTYQQHPCVNNTEVEMQVKGVSSVGSEGLRHEAAAREQEKQQAYIKQLQIEAAMRPDGSTEFSDYSAIRARAKAAKRELEA